MTGSKPPGDDPIDGKSELAQPVLTMLERLAGQTVRPGLYVVATPIGNLGDITLRALVTLSAVDLIYCEDTRHSRTLLAHYGIRTPCRSYHEHNADAERPRIIAAIADGKRVALVSDAGTPLISDPGFKLVRSVHDEGQLVTVLPGACAAIAALAGAGLPTDTFLFAGFLPVKVGQRQTRLAELAAVDATLVFYEAPQRLTETLRAIGEGLGSRETVVARELTKQFEEIRRGTAVELAQHFESTPPRGEIVILVGPPAAYDVSDAEIEDRLRVALTSASLRDAAKEIAARLGVPKPRVYQIGLQLKRAEDAPE